MNYGKELTILEDFLFNFNIPVFPSRCKALHSSIALLLFCTAVDSNIGKNGLTLWFSMFWPLRNMSLRKMSVDTNSRTEASKEKLEIFLPFRSELLTDRKANPADVL